MRKSVFVTTMMCALLLLALTAYGQRRSPNVLWARSTAGATITLDGVLNEPVWAKAESIRVQYGNNSHLITGSGWKQEAGVAPSDPTDAMLKFLVNGNVLYVAVVAKDSSVGGGLFNRFDGLLMNLRNHVTRDANNFTAPPFEYFYGWVTEPWADTTTGRVGASPGFFGWAGGRRDSVLAEGFKLSDVWNAVTTVQGTSNDDATPDVSWTTELSFTLDPHTWVFNPQTGERRNSGGYNVTRPEGDILEFNISIYDADWQWPVQAGRFSGNRTWFQGPWGNASEFDIVRIHARPDVTVNTTSLPEIGPDIIIPNAAYHDRPIIDGKLDEAVWTAAPGLDISYGDEALRDSYPGIGRWRSGQFQPPINNVKASVVDPGDATIKWFFKGNTLYLAADVRDQVLWSNDVFDQWDGIRFIINDRAQLDTVNHNLARRELTVLFDENGALRIPQTDYLFYLRDSLHAASVGLALKPNSTVNNFNDADQGYTIELALDLLKLGYPPGRGDGLLFISADLFDGDNFPNAADNYGTRTWWMREHQGNASPAWAYMDPFTILPAPPTASVLERPNVIWARVSDTPITVDGKLDEAAWSKAETMRLQYGDNTHLIPGSGWKKEAGADPSDPTDAMLKFMVNGNVLYVAVVAKDSSVGGGLFNRFDGLLMNLRNHVTRDVNNFTAPPFEYFYGWVTEPWADTTTGRVGASPGFFGWAGGRRDSVLAEGFKLSDVWNAVTTVQGTSNDDATPDVSWTTELSFTLDPHTWVFNPQTGERRNSGGYNVTRPEGDILEFNISIYDADWQWPVQAGKFSGNRTWFQGPWGNASEFDIIRIYARPDVTVNSGPVPQVGPEIIIPNAGSLADPVIDGKLDEQVWTAAPGLDIRYGDDALRDSYPGIGRWRSGQFQPPINNVKASVVDPGDATIKWFFKGDWLYLAADVRDQVVWNNSAFDQWDGIRFILNDRKALDPDNQNLRRRELTVLLDDNGGVRIPPNDYLITLRDTLNAAKVGLALKPNTTVNNFNDSDQGYTIELALDLTKLGYPSGRGDGVLFISIDLFDGDNFPNPVDDYGTRTWWMREHQGNAGPAWAFMDPNTLLTGVAGRDETVPLTFALIGNYPNPFNPSTTIQYTMPEPGLVTLKVFDILGRSVKTIPLGLQTTGRREVLFSPDNLSTGVYLYRLEMTSSTSRKQHATLFGKFMLIK